MTIIQTSFRSSSRDYRRNLYYEQFFWYMASFLFKTFICTAQYVDAIEMC